MKVNIKFIWHDCFVIYLPDCTIITDFWETAPSFAGKFGNRDCFLRDILTEIPLYVLVSHHHKDHFSREIFTWQSRFPQIRYIISKDTARSINYILKEGSTYSGIYHVERERVSILRPGESYEDRYLRITAFGSTDIGNSYLIDYKGKTIFHAGDLNAWIWKDESSQDEVDAAISQFQAILNTIGEQTECLDVAFFPVDDRIGTDWWTGASIFVRKFQVKYFIPMHFCLAKNVAQLQQRKDDAVAFQLYENPNAGSYIALTEPYDSTLLTI